MTFLEEVLIFRTSGMTILEEVLIFRTFISNALQMMRSLSKNIQISRRYAYLSAASAVKSIIFWRPRR